MLVVAYAQPYGHLGSFAGSGGFLTMQICNCCSRGSEMAARGRMPWQGKPLIIPPQKEQHNPCSEEVSFYSLGIKVLHKSKNNVAVTT